MISMKKDKVKMEKNMDHCMPKDEYPWGLTINLDNDSLKKLGIDKTFPMGKKLLLTANVEVCSASKRETEDGQDLSMSLQITDMDLGGEEESTADRLYKKKG